MSRVENLEKALGTPVKIFYKYQRALLLGVYKHNTAFFQVYYNKVSGVRNLPAETGVG